MRAERNRHDAHGVATSLKKAGVCVTYRRSRRGQIAWNRNRSSGSAACRYDVALHHRDQARGTHDRGLVGIGHGRCAAGALRIVGVIRS
jgi:hypothetical protein